MQKDLSSLMGVGSFHVASTWSLNGSDQVQEDIYVSARSNVWTGGMVLPGLGVPSGSADLGKMLHRAQ